MDTSSIINHKTVNNATINAKPVLIFKLIYYVQM